MPSRPSTHSISFAVFVVATGAVGLAAAGDATAAPAPAHDSRVGEKDCIKFWAEPRFAGLGYNHLVHIQNSCSGTAHCTVTTDANPKPETVDVAMGAETVVNTFLGSPARAFTPKVTCAIGSS